MVERIGDGGVCHHDEPIMLGRTDEEDELIVPLENLANEDCPTLDAIFSTDMEAQVGWLTHKCENLEERLETA